MECRVGQWRRALLGRLTSAPRRRWTALGKSADGDRVAGLSQAAKCGPRRPSSTTSDSLALPANHPLPRLSRYSSSRRPVHMLAIQEWGGVGCWVEALENGPSGGVVRLPLLGGAPRHICAVRQRLSKPAISMCKSAASSARHTPCEATNAAVHQLVGRHG